MTKRPKHAIEVARALDNADPVYVFGGDGLLNEVLNGLGQEAVVGVLPGGRTNVVAGRSGSHSIPLPPRGRSSPERHGGSRSGRVNGRRFAFAAGLGFDAELVRRVDRHGRRSDGRRPGDLLFAWETTKLLTGWRGRREPLLEIEGFGRAAFALVANAIRIRTPAEGR
jgi:diacylglycerol kinase family enzyme